MNKLRIAIEPQIAEACRPEIHWVWRLLLTTAGWPWEEVGLDSACDIAYVTTQGQAPAAKLLVRCNLAAWRQRATRSLSEEAIPPYTLYRRAEQFVCEHDLLFDTFWIATGQAERGWPSDRHGFHYLNGVSDLPHHIRRQALGSQIIRWFEDSLLQLGYPPPVPRWPHGKCAAAAVGHDVDYPQVIRWLEPLRIVLRQGARGLRPALDVLIGRRYHWHFLDWLELERRLQTRSAFYFVPRRGSLLEYAAGTPDPFYDVGSPKFKALFRELAEAGWEIGLHASYRAYESVEKFAAEKQRLEAASGQTVVGNRHHYWHMNPDDVEETLLMHEQVGLEYDSSLVLERYLGWRRGLSHPYFAWHQAERRELKTLQVPVAWMDNHLFGHAANNPGQRAELLQGLADRAAAQGGCLVIDIHSYVFDDALFPGWTQAYVQLWESLCERGDFWFATPAEIARHWTARYAALVRTSHGLYAGTA